MAMFKDANDGCCVSFVIIVIDLMILECINSILQHENCMFRFGDLAGEAHGSRVGLKLKN